MSRPLLCENAAMEYIALMFVNIWICRHVFIYGCVKTAKDKLMCQLKQYFQKGIFYNLQL